jgi:hypothetical protein
MSVAHLDVRADAYELRLNGKLLARLDGGAAALLAGAGERLRDLDIEAAIERSEDWLMPFSKLMSDLELRVQDGTDRVCRVLGEQTRLTATDDRLTEFLVRVCASSDATSAPVACSLTHTYGLSLVCGNYSACAFHANSSRVATMAAAAASCRGERATSFEKRATSCGSTAFFAHCFCKKRSTFCKFGDWVRKSPRSNRDSWPTLTPVAF